MVVGDRISLCLKVASQSSERIWLPERKVYFLIFNVVLVYGDQMEREGGRNLRGVQRAPRSSMDPSEICCF